ncbi:MAG: DUF4097 family beta strand repeat protein [Treponema sp.]|nr:DUF4097 family beta strand repeat protein [Treponema sp.]
MKRIVLSVLALLAFTACVSAGAPAGDPTWPEAQSVLNQGIKADGIKKIEINLKNEALNISLSENENITIEILSNHQMGNPQVSVDPKAIKIEQKEKTNKLNKRNCTINITIPKKNSIQYLMIQNGDALSSISDIKVDAFSFKSDGGAVAINDADVAKVVDVSTGNADIQIKKVACSELKVNTNKGNINISDAEANNFSISSDKGSMDLDFPKMFEKDSSVYIGSGTAKISLPSSADFWTSGDIGSGRFRSEFAQDSKGPKFKYKVSGGDMRLLKR